MRWYFAVATGLYCGMIFWLSSRPVPELVPGAIMDFDKVLHAGCFGVLALLVSGGMGTARRPYSLRVLFWAPFLFAAGYGASDELHQYFIPERVHDFWDWVADCAGAFLCAGAGWYFWRGRGMG